MSAASHADAGNVTQDDDTQADDDYDNGLDDGHQTDTDSKVRAESIRALRRADQTKESQKNRIAIISSFVPGSQSSTDRT